MSNKLDIILFGASGFTGTFCIESLHKLTKINGRSFTWGIAGRSESKLKEALQEYENKIGEDLSAVPIILADINNFESLKKMTGRAKSIINCCGPYRFYGEPVIKACIETGTHQVDVSGEPQYMENIQYKYNAAALEKGIYIVSACGFDSVPADFGVLLLQEKFGGTVNSVEINLQLYGSDKNTGINFATYESAVHGVGAARELGQLRRKLYPTPLPKFRPKLEARPSIHKNELTNKWSVPFLGSDRSVVQRTQRYLFDNKIVRPIQVHTYIGVQTLYGLMLMVVFSTIFAFLVKYKWGRTLLLKYPSLFTAGWVKPERRSKSTHTDGQFQMLFESEGWDGKLSDVIDEFKTPPNKKVVARLVGKEPTYVLTGNIVTLAAITILSETNKLPTGGGVYTPGVAFRETSLMKTLEADLNFEIL